MDIIEMIGKEIDDFSKEAAFLYEKGFEQGLTGKEPREDHWWDRLDRFYCLGIEHGAAWRKLRADLGLIKKGN